jgi:type II secretory pathway pseudopilin PulG
MVKLAATIVASILALMAYVLYENLSISLERSRQKRTMADMRTIATALEARATDLKSFSMGPPPKAAFNAGALSFGKMRQIALIDVQRALSPKYTRKVPTHDGWGHPFDIRVGFYDAEGRAQRYAIRSVGSDGKAQGQTYTHARTRTFAEDILFGDGNFYRYPDGV